MDGVCTDETPLSLEEVNVTLNEARLIREVKKSCTFRRLAEVYYDPEDRGYGNQYDGMWLCKEACETLGIDGTRDYNSCDESFREENESYVGKFWWWE